MIAPGGVIAAGNLLAPLADATAAERVRILLAVGGARIEQIVSAGQASPEGFWYDQADTELVVLLAGGAGLEILGEAAPRVLTPGDYLILPARCRHRVTWTSRDPPAVWLAVHTMRESAHETAADTPAAQRG